MCPFLLTEELVKVLTPILVTVVGGVTTWILAELSRWIRTKTKNENALAAIEDIVALVRTAVSEVGQTVQAAAADGKFTPEERKGMKELAMGKVKTQIPHAVERNAIRMINTVDDFIAARIEREVAKAKRGV